MVHAEAKIFEIFKEPLKNPPFYGGSAQGARDRNRTGTPLSGKRRILRTTYPL
jgi:hypothetical protein